MKSSIFQNKIIRNAFVLLFWLIIWFLLSKTINQDLIFPGPFQVLNTLLKLIVEKQFWIHCFTSLFRILIGYIFGVIASLLLVLLSCVSETFKSLLSPIIKVIRSSPVASFIILALLWMSKSRVVSFIVMSMVIPIVYESVLNEYYSVDNKLIEMSDAYGFSLYKKIIYIYLPSIKSSFLASCLNAMGLSWKSGIATEVLALPKSSIGSQLYYSKIYLETSELFAWTIVVILLSSLIELLIKKLLRGHIDENK